MLLVELLVGAAAAAVLIPVLILTVETIAALFARESRDVPGPRPPLAVIIPAHNESSGIRDTLRSLSLQLQSGDRVVVVADNCTDDTAAVAASEGAEVLVRTNAAERGKGYALDFAVRHLEANPPRAVLIIDADCRVGEHCLARLANSCARASRPVQALYLIQALPEAGLKVRIAEFASLLKNRVRPLGLRWLGLPCQLMGTGMIFPWGCIRKATLATGHIVEDLKLGLELTSMGYPPLFCPEAQVTSYFPASEEGFKSQRTRWEHGYLGVCLRDAPALLIKGVLTLNGGLLSLALDLSVPPIALLTLCAAAAWVAAALLYGIERADLPLLLASAAVSLLTLSVLTSWARYARGILPLRSLIFAVAYALWKIPVYVRFLAGRQMEWVRTKRDQDRSA